MYEGMRLDITELSIEGAYAFAPTVHTDERGSFHEWFRADEFERTVGHPFTFAQANCSVSAAGTVRGIHFAQLPPSQAKYVACSKGAIVDVVVDVRVGSPTYGRWDAVQLNDRNHKAVYLAEGLGHAFIALEDDSVVNYLCSAPYAPGREHAINPYDEEIGIEWPETGIDGSALSHLLSPKDHSAPRLAELARQDVLPQYEAAMTWRSQLGRSASSQ